MYGYVNGIDWVNAEAMKYWSFPASYTQEKKKKEYNDAVFSGNYLGALKVDGYYQRLIKDEDGNCFMIARSKNVKGEAVNKIDWVPQIKPFMDLLSNGTVLLCECYLPGNEGSKNVTSLLGCLKDKCIERQEKGQKLHLYVFDICALAGKNLVDVPAKERFALLHSQNLTFESASEYVTFAEYYSGLELHEKLQAYLAEGREGMVITREDCPIYFKRTPAHMTIKIKQELRETIDVIILGANAPTRSYGGKEIESWKYWENMRTGEKLEGDHYKDYSDGLPIEPITKAYFHGWAGSLIIGLYDAAADKVVPIGSVSGLTEEVLQNWQSYKGKVLEVGGMQLMRDDKGEFTGIRHPKAISFRTDKTARECTMDQVK